MSNIWSYIVLALLLQEPATTDAALFQARTHSLDLWLVHLIWIIATTIDIWLGFRIGKWLQHFYAGTKFETFSKKWAVRVEHYIGKRGEKFVLVLLGVINFPWANSFIASWLDLDYRTMFLFIFLGDAIWYVLEWGINFGVRSVIPSPHLAIYAVIIGGLLLGIISKFILNKVLK